MSAIDGVPMPAAPTRAAPVTTLAFNAGVNLTRDVRLMFDATSLTAVKRACYRYSGEEQLKLDAIVRRYDVKLVHRFRMRLRAGFVGREPVGLHSVR